MIDLVLLVITIVNTQINPINIQVREDPLVQVEPIETSCITLETEQHPTRCQHIEDLILASTVRIEMSGFHLVGGQRLPLAKGGKSHATIVGGRYLKMPPYRRLTSYVKTPRLWFWNL